jgi:integrase
VLHDLRRTFASIHASIGTPIHIIEKLLNHVSGQLSVDFR